MMNERSGLEKGDVVQLKSGGPEMTIKDFDNGSGDCGAFCQWFIGLVETAGWFATESLQLVQGDEDEHDCNDCKHSAVDIDDKPCQSCDLSEDNWEPAEPEPMPGRNGKWEPLREEAVGKWFKSVYGAIVECIGYHDNPPTWDMKWHAKNRIGYIEHWLEMLHSDVQIPPKPILPAGYGLTGDVRRPKQGELYMGADWTHVGYACCDRDGKSIDIYRDYRWIVRAIPKEDLTGKWFVDTESPANVIEIIGVAEDGDPAYRAWQNGVLARTVTRFGIYKRFNQDGRYHIIPPMPKAPAGKRLTGEVRRPKNVEQFVDATGVLAVAQFDYDTGDCYQGCRWIVEDVPEPKPIWPTPATWGFGNFAGMNTGCLYLGGRLVAENVSADIRPLLLLALNNFPKCVAIIKESADRAYQAEAIKLLAEITANFDI